MLKNYLKIAWRNLVREKTYSFINISGLAVGIACCLLIFLYVQHELSYDRFHSDSNLIYRVLYDIGSEKLAMTPIPLAGTIEEGIPEIESAVRLTGETTAVKKGNEIFREEVLFADQGFFGMFDFAIIRGNRSDPLSNPDQIVISQSYARKYFHGTDPIGKSLQIRIEDKYRTYKVAAVTEDAPENSSIKFNLLLPVRVLEQHDRVFSQGSNWGTLNPSTYIRVVQGTDPAQLQNKISRYVSGNVGMFSGNPFRAELQSLEDIHLSPEISGGLEPASDPNYAYILIGIGVFILGIACINFMVISVGRSVKRAREVGMRKTLGAVRRQLVYQFLGESLLTALLGLVVGLFLAELVLPAFNQLTGTALSLNPKENFQFLFGLLGLVAVTGLLGGSYPAAYLSSFRPADVLTGQFTIRGKSTFIQSLIVIQFSLSVILIVSTIVMDRQMNLLMNKNLGFNEEQVIRLDVPQREGREIMKRLRSEMQNNPDVLSVSGSWNTLGNYEERITYNDISVESEGQEVRAYEFGIDQDLIRTLDIGLKAGRELRTDTENKSVTRVLVNEELVKSFGWENPVGKSLTAQFTGIGKAEVVGVVEDFNFRSLHNPVTPLVIYPASYIVNIYIRLSPGDIPQTLSSIRGNWSRIAPGLPFVFHFLDDEIDAQYRNAAQWASAVRYASGMGILIACLGLFGLAMLMSVRRIKEIGVRKILGATVSGVVGMLTRDLLKPVLIGFFIALPIAYLIMSSWLREFAYRTEIGISVFILAGLGTIIIALLTVSWQSVRAALANPAEALRSE